MRGFRGLYAGSLIGVVLLYVSMTLAGCSMGGGGDPVVKSASGAGIFSTDSIYDLNEEFNKGVTELTYRIIPALSVERSSQGSYSWTLTGIVKVYKVDASRVIVDAEGSGYCLNCDKYVVNTLGDWSVSCKIGCGLFKLEKGVIVDTERARGWGLTPSVDLDLKRVKLGGFINRCAFSFFIYNLRPEYIECFAPPCPVEALYLTISALNEECLKEFE